MLPLSHIPCIAKHILLEKRDPSGVIAFSEAWQSISTACRQQLVLLKGQLFAILNEHALHASYPPVHNFLRR